MAKQTPDTAQPDNENNKPVVRKKRRIIKQPKPETVRERATKAANEQPKPRRIKQISARAGRPLRTFGSAVAKLMRPLRFLLAPFRTKPARFIGRILGKLFLISYFKNSWRELRKVTWPNRRQTARLTLAVYLFAIGLTALVASSDWVLNRIFKEILLN